MQNKNYEYLDLDLNAKSINEKIVSVYDRK